MLKSYLNETALYSRAIRDADGHILPNSYGETHYEEPQLIRCRRQPRARELLQADRRIVQTSYEYYSTTPMQVGDLLDGRRIEEVTKWVSLGGAVLCLKAVV